MDLPSTTALAKLKFYLRQFSGKICICSSVHIPQKSVEAFGFELFYYYGRELSKPENYIEGDLRYLPFLTDNIDVFIFWDNLELEDEPEKVLKDLWRILAPNGVFIACGKNFPSLTRYDQTNFTPRTKLIRLIKQRGFNIEVEETFGFLPNKTPKSLRKFLKPIEVIGHFCWPRLGESYFILARKPILGMTPLAATQVKRKKVRAKGLIQPVSNQ